MSTLKSHTLKIVIVLNLLFLLGCTFTQTFKPEFNGKQDSVLNAIKTTYGFEDITFTGKKKSGSGGDHSSLMVKFINGKNVPTDTAKMYDLEKLLGTQIKGIVKKPKEFNTYIILFDKVVIKKGAAGDVTNEDYTGHEFNYSEL